MRTSGDVYVARPSRPMLKRLWIRPGRPDAGWAAALSDPGYLVCSGVIDSEGKHSEFRWVVDEARQRVVAIQVREDTCNDWRAATHAEGDSLLAAIQAKIQPQRCHPARRTPIWAEVPSATRRMTAAALEAQRIERMPRRLGSA